MSQESRLSLSELNAKIMTCSELYDVGLKSSLDVNTLIDHSEDMEHVAVLMYTSGSTGMPKGVCLKRLNIMSGMEISNTVLTPYLKTKHPVLYDFLPTAHIMGRITEYIVINLQGTLC